MFTVNYNILILHRYFLFIFFFFNDTAPTEIYTLSLHDALPIFEARVEELLEYIDKELHKIKRSRKLPGGMVLTGGDRKSTRLNSSHQIISYAVFCLKKKKINKKKKLRKNTKIR